MTRIVSFAAVALLAALVSVPLFAGDKEEATYRKIESQLNSTTIDTLAYEDADVTEVVKDIARKARVTIVIDKKALEDVSDEDRKITLELASVKAINALNIVIDQIGLFKAYKNGVLYITTEEKAKEATVIKTYDVRDITVRIQDFPAPELKLRPADDSGTSGPIIQIPDEDTPTTDDIVDMIQDSIDADWGDTASINIVKGQLIVRAPRNIQKEVANLLDLLRAAK